MEQMHSLLKRQIRRYFGDQFHIPKEWKEFISAVNDAYRESDVDRTMIERSLELSSQELIQTNSEMRTIFQAIPDLLFRLDNKGRILDYKAGATVDFLLQPKELIGKRIQDVPSQHVSQKFREAIQQVLELKTMVNIEYPLSIQSQQHFYEARLLPLLEDQIIVVIRDITERKRAEEALTYERNLLKALMDNIPDHIYFKDKESRFLRISRSLANTFGIDDPAQAVGKTDFDFFAEDHARPAFEDEQKAMESGIAIVGLEEKEWWPDGRQTWVSTTKVPLQDAQGEIIGTFGISRDITERKNAEIALHESQQMLRTVLDTVPVRVFWKDKNDIYLGCNLPFAKDSGFNSPDEITGKDDFQMGWREQAELYRADDRQIMESGIPKLAYEEPESFDKGIRWVRTSKSPLRNAEGEVVGVLGTYEDVTESKQAALLLAYERYLLNALLENTVDSIYFKDTEGRFTRVSATTVAKRGLTSVDQLLGKTDFDFFTKERAQEMYEQEQEIIRTHKPVVDVEIQELWTDRPPTWVSVTKVPLDDPAGKIVGLFGISRDTTERKNAEIALRESEEKFRGLVEGSASAIWIHDVQRFLYANPAALEMTGYTAEELYRVAPREIVHPDCREFVMKRAEERMERKDVPKHYEYQIMKKSGEAIWIDSSGAAIDYQGKPAIIASAYDISDRKRLEEQLVQAQKMEGIGRLAGGVAHDYNNMLGVIIGYSDLIMKKMNKAEPVYRFVELIASAAKRGADITRQLLAFARREIVSPRVLNANKAIESLQKMLQRLIGENVKLMFLPEKNVWNVKIDQTQLDQILVNLATNARDAIDDVGTITIETSNASIGEAYTQNRIDFSPGEYVVISFTDTGKGMSKETMENIFEPFFTTKSKGQGTGLGLSTVYGIVKQNGGSINVYSEMSVGTTFKIYLPRYQGEVEEPEADQVERSIGGSETVLIVEDQDDLLELAKNSLEEYGYKVLTASSPGESILLCETYESEIHLLLTDVIMPVMNGKELRDEILTIKPDIKTVFMSGYTANVIAHRGVLDEGVDFIQKPFSPYALAKKVYEVLRI